MNSFYTDNRAGGNPEVRFTPAPAYSGPVAVRLDNPASVNGSFIADALKGTQLRYVVQLHYTGYPVAALAMGRAALDLAAHLNKEYSPLGEHKPYSVWDLHTKTVYTGEPHAES